MAALVATLAHAVQDPAAFAAQHTAHFGGAGALPLTQLILVDSPEPARLLVTLAACPRTPPEAAASNHAAPSPMHSRTEQPAPCPPLCQFSSEVGSSLGADSASAPALVHTGMQQPAAEGAAPIMQAPGAALAGAAPGREGAQPCQLTVERFDWRSTRPEVLELAAWDARTCGSALVAGRTGCAEGIAEQACAATDGSRSAGASGSQSRANSTYASQPEPERGRDPDPAALESAEQGGGCTSAACKSFQTSSHQEDPALLRLATGTFRGSQLDLPRGRHLMRLRAGFGRACTVELRSCAPFRAGDAVQVGLPALHHKHEK